MEERKPNPFLDFAGRVAQVPVNAVRLPFQLLNEAVGSPTATAGHAAEDLQRQMAQQLTGQEVPYSEGRRWASALSLGLVPGNPSPAVNPQQLTPEQQGQFNQMSPLHQALLQAKRPSDFAALLSNDDFFAEQKPNTDLGQLNQDVERGFVTPEQREAAMAPTGSIVPSGAAVVDAQGKPIYENRPPPPPLSPYQEGQLAIGRDRLEMERGKAKDAQALNAKRMEKLDADIAKLKEASGAPASTPKERRAIQVMETSVSNKTTKRTKDLARAATSWRNIDELGQVRGTTNVPADQLAELRQYGFASPDAVGVPLVNRSPDAIRNLLVMTNVVRLGDPYGRITDKDVDMYSKARQYLSPGLVEAAMNGQVWTADQEAEALHAAAQAAKGLLKTHDLAVLDGRKEALRDRIAGSGTGMNPLNAAADEMVDLRTQLRGAELGDQAQYPTADPEAEALIEQMWQIVHPDRKPTAAEAIEFANTLGFGISELGAQ